MSSERDLLSKDVRPKADKSVVKTLFRGIGFNRVLGIKTNELKTKTKALILQNPNPQDLQRVDRRKK